MDRKDIGIVKEILPGIKVTIIMQERGECSGCPSESSCHLFSEKGNTVTALSDEKLIPGDRVEIYVKPANRIISSIIVFILPLVFLFSGYIAVFNITDNESAAIISGMGLLVLTFAVLFLLNSKFDIFKNISCRAKKAALKS